MKKLILAATMLVGFTGAVAAQSKQDFVLVNRTGYDISELYVSPGKKTFWAMTALRMAIRRPSVSRAQAASASGI